jgi:hypothetical protein
MGSPIDDEGVSRPPFEPGLDLSQSGSTEHAVGTDPSPLLKAAMVGMALSIIGGLVAVGLLAAVVWIFAACFGDDCTDADVWLALIGPLAGLGVGLGIAWLIWWTRRFFYARPNIVWVAIGLIGWILAASALSYLAI